MNTLTFRSRIDAPAPDVFAWHERPGAFERLTPPWADVRMERFEGIQDGDQAVIRLGAGPLHLRWVAEHADYVEGRQFKDRQVQGPFKRWTHTHRMLPNGSDDEASYLEDHLSYELPLDGLGQLGQGLVQKELRRQFAYRHRITQQDLSAHRRYAKRPLRIAITGASGLLGSALAAFLTTGGHEVLRVTRRAPAGPGEVYWNISQGLIEAEKLEGLDAVVHLAGENVFALRWTEEKKRRIYRSRADGTKLLSETLASLDAPPSVLVSASAIGIYGDRGSEVVTEQTPAAEHGFLPSVCQAWEAATRPAADAGIRVVNTRIGVVLSPAGGALKQMLPVFQIGLGGSIGRKGLYFSWVALDDVLLAIYHALHTDTLTGPVNVASPNPVTMETYAQTLARVLSRPALFHVPGGLLRAVSGEAAEEILLTSARVLPERLESSGYSFLYADLEEALRHLLGRTPVVPAVEAP